ncbi:hypothetical protein [Litoribrevibacter albus]|uniref:GyrI-like small molecule binding domain-containing protein n=1 Tax=Litoribrevibacter albus TaxID=1473156 RepID=A0AA37SE02_9GAMM|nr:hypothetical protein [Litoribrevibacter albus]GLQ32826.1 hypothetical protein GCM10007876_33050 [Litoribrevibacter albus]
MTRLISLVVLPVFVLLLNLSSAFASPTLNTGLDLTSLEVKDIPARHWYFGEYSIQQAKDQPTTEALAKRLAQTIAFQTTTEIDGAFSLVVEGATVDSILKEDTMIQLGWWVKREGEPKDEFKSELKPEAHCLVAQFKGNQTELMLAWHQLYLTALDRGYQVVGNGRTLINLHSNTGYMMAELQLVIE